MGCREVLVSDANEHLLGVFRALFDLPEFRKYVDEHFVIKQYYNSSDGRLLRSEVAIKNDCKDIMPASSTRH